MGEGSDVPHGSVSQAGTRLDVEQQLHASVVRKRLAFRTWARSHFSKREAASLVSEIDSERALLNRLRAFPITTQERKVVDLLDASAASMRTSVRNHGSTLGRRAASEAKRLTKEAVAAGGQSP